jgi:hypothetical protein
MSVHRAKANVDAVRLSRDTSGIRASAAMNYNASAATSWFKRTSSHAGLLFVNQIGSILRVGMQRNRPFAGSC